jgi:hypothetical protein
MWGSLFLFHDVNLPVKENARERERERERETE